LPQSSQRKKIFLKHRKI